MSKEIEILEFEVIANYPNSVFAIGDIVKCYAEGRTYLTPELKDSPCDYPALFKPLTP